MEGLSDHGRTPKKPFRRITRGDEFYEVEHFSSRTDFLHKGFFLYPLVQCRPISQYRRISSLLMDRVTFYLCRANPGFQVKQEFCVSLSQADNPCKRVMHHFVLMWPGSGGTASQTSNPSPFKFFLISCSSRADSANCVPNWAASRCIFSWNGSPSSSTASAPTYLPGVRTYP